MTTNIFIVRTPLQAFNAIEAKKRFSQGRKNIIIIIYRNDSDRNIIKNILSEKEWKSITYKKIKPHLQLFSFFYSLLKSYPIVNFCFLGDHSTLINYYMNRVKYKKLILLEDGTATIRKAQLLESKLLHRIKKTAYSKKNNLELFFEKILKLDINYYYDSSFFTIYKLNNNVNMINNDYRFFKKKITNFPQKEVAFFIGQNIRDRVLINDNIFEEHIENIVHIYNKRNIEFYYILHRKEDEKYMKILADKLGFKFINFHNIIELEFLTIGYIPFEIATFYSTALTTLHSLYPSKYKYYYIKSNGINEKFHDSIKNVYIEFQKENFERLN